MRHRVHFHTDCYWFGGSELTLAVVVRALRSDPRFDVDLTYRPSAVYDDGASSRAPDLSARPLPLPDVGRWRSGLVSAAARLPRPFRAMAAVAPIRQVALIFDIVMLIAVLLRRRPRIVHVNNGGFPGAVSCNAAALAAWAVRVPVVAYTVNNLAEPYHSWSRRIDRPVDRLVVRAVNCFITGSEAAAAALSDVLALPSQGAQVRVLPNTILPGSPTDDRAGVRSRLAASDDTVVVLLPAVFEARKGHAVLIDALDFVDKDRLVVALLGTGEERAGIERLVIERDLESTVRFLAGENVWDLYEAADLVALPSIRNEDFPIVVLEAMSAGLPVIASRVAGTPEQVVDGTTGILVAPGDAHALAVAIQRLAANPDERLSMGRAGKERFEREFSPARAVDRYRRLYFDLLEVDS